MQLLILITLFSSLLSGILNVPDSYTTIQEAVNASRYASGIYFVQIVSDNYKMTKRMTLIK